jgi:hypothetical protein
MPGTMTEIEKYDRAVFDYLSTISGKIVYAPTQVAIRTITKKEQFSDKKPWNFISYYRNPSFEVDWNRMNNPAAVTGDFVRLTKLSDNTREARYVHNIPVNLTYNVEIWASKATEVQELAIALVTKIYMQEQVLEVPINPDGELGRFHLLDVSWNDNSDLERETEIGKIYRHTISFTVDARITFVRDINTTKFCTVPVDIYEECKGELDYDND